MPAISHTEVRTGASAVDTLCGLIATAILFVIFVTLNPFSDLGYADPSQSGSEAPIYFVLLVLTVAAGLLLYSAGRFTLPSLATPANIALLAWLLAVGVALSVEPSVSARRFVLAFLSFLLAAMLAPLTRGLRHLIGLLLFTAAVVLILCYLGIVLAPHLTIHQAGDLVEPDLAGKWRGIYGHKNVAAGVMAVFVYTGWFALRTGQPKAGGAVALAALIFLIFSGGKTELALLFVVPMIAALVVRARSIWLKAFLAFAPLVMLAFLTIGATVSTTAQAILRALSIDPTFTGRTDIWNFALTAIAAHPWKGHGFEAFWFSEALRHSLEGKTKWLSQVATSHNSYIDVALTIGIPGLVLTLVAFLVQPLKDFHRTLPSAENWAFAQFLLLLWLFALYTGTFEAFFFNRVAPMWFVLALAVCGLRCTRLFPVKA
ncbi:MAG: O-antigen ligase family protein [Xanthobacteraceae bacterium]|nr:O-antigen ligase family protein [Xanthobacteraceae bacterium]